MISELPTKRRRGGQPGNQNANSNRGNRSARGKVGNRGGKGAPCGNQFACKSRTLEAELLKEFQHCPEAVAWVQSNAERLREISVADDNRIAFGAYLGLTPEALAARGQEYRYGLYCDPGGNEGSEEILSA
jgi:hypothetical protein